MIMNDVIHKMANIIFSDVKEKDISFLECEQIALKIIKSLIYEGQMLKISQALSSDPTKFFTNYWEGDYSNPNEK